MELYGEDIAYFLGTISWALGIIIIFIGAFLVILSIIKRDMSLFELGAGDLMLQGGGLFFGMIPLLLTLIVLILNGLWYFVLWSINFVADVFYNFINLI
jgi:hypothetical protein